MIGENAIIHGYPTAFFRRCSYRVIISESQERFHDRQREHTTNAAQGRAATASGKHSQRAARRRNVLCHRTRLGALAALVAAHCSAGLRPRHGPAPARQRRGRAVGDHRSPRPEILPQPLRLLLGGSRRPVPLAAAAAVCPLGRSGVALDGRPVAGVDGRRAAPVWDVELAGRAAGRGARLDRLLFPQPATAAAARAWAVGLRRPTARSPR